MGRNARLQRPSDRPGLRCGAPFLAGQIHEANVPLETWLPEYRVRQIRSLLEGEQTNVGEEKNQP